MNEYFITIKAGTDMPDFEQITKAKNRKEAIEVFYNWLQGEFDRKFISQKMARMYKNGKTK